jgi:hypothetical protein
MSPTITLTPSADGSEWSASLAGIDGLDAIAATAPTAEEAAGLARVATQAACLTAAAAQGLTVGPIELASLEMRLRQAASLALASLDPAPLPTASDYGADVSTFAGALRNDLHPYLPLISGKRVVAEVVARRLLTPTGLLDYVPGGGFDVRGLLNQGFTPAQFQAFSTQIATEAEADERVESAAVTITFAESTQTLTIRIVLRTAAGPFTLVLNVSAFAVELAVLP